MTNFDYKSMNPQPAGTRGQNDEKSSTEKIKKTPSDFTFAFFSGL